MAAKQVESWFVYRRPMKGSPDGVNAVCEAAEWDAMELERPDYLTLMQAGIASEGWPSSWRESCRSLPFPAVTAPHHLPY